MYLQKRIHRQPTLTNSALSKQDSQPIAYPLNLSDLLMVGGTSCLEYR